MLTGSHHLGDDVIVFEELAETNGDVRVFTKERSTIDDFSGVDTAQIVRNNSVDQVAPLVLMR
jgi:hypothetical protein